MIILTQSLMVMKTFLNGRIDNVGLAIEEEGNAMHLLNVFFIKPLPQGHALLRCSYR